MSDPVQFMSALERANQVRIARSALKRAIFNRETTVAAVVLTNPPDAQSMTVFMLLDAQRDWGPHRVRRFLASLPLSETRTVGALTERQRQAVATRLNGEWATLEIAA